MMNSLRIEPEQNWPHKKLIEHSMDLHKGTNKICLSRPGMKICNNLAQVFAIEVGIDFRRRN